MAEFIYIASRNLVPEHSAGNQYVLPVEVVTVSEVSETISERQTALSGLMETVYFRTEVVWQFEITQIPFARINNWREFAESTAAGEGFNFDPQGITGNAPAITDTLQRIGGSYTFARLGLTDFCRVGFSARRV